MILKEKLKIIFSILIIVLIIGYFQRESLKLDIFWDDYNAFRAYSFEDLIKGFYKSTAALMESSVHAYRPMFQVMFHAAYSICGFNSFKLHAMMIALQVLQTVTAFLFFRLLTQRDSVALVNVIFSLFFCRLGISDQRNIRSYFLHINFDYYFLWKT
ncbi:MAG: hypothetical protein HY758_00180 [Nitrospirae bacterium]|nr:hypothetical protein [Nitrospirota bacterium]